MTTFNNIQFDVNLEMVLIDTRDFGHESHRILYLRFFQKYTVRLSSRGYLFYGLQTNGDHKDNRKKILNKPGGTD